MFGNCVEVLAFADRRTGVFLVFLLLPTMSLAAGNDLRSRGLEAIYVDALDYYQELPALEKEAAAAEFEVKKTFWQFFPNMTYSFNNRFDSNSQSILTLEQPVFEFGRHLLDRKVSKSTLKLAQGAIAQSEQELLIAVTESFYQLAASVLRIEIRRESISEHQRLFELIDRRVSVEKSPSVDRSLAESRLESAKSALNAELSRSQQLQAQLGVYLGYMLVEPAWPVEEEPLDVENPEFLTVGLSANEELNQSRRELEVLTEKRKRTEVEVLPSISLVLEKRKGYFDLFDPEENRGYLKLVYETGNGLEKRNNSQAARMREAAGLARVAATETRMKAQLAALIYRFTAAAEEAERSVGLIDSINEVRSSYLRQYTVGRKSWLDVMNVSREWFDARSQGIEWRRERDAAHWQLKVLAGRINATMLKSKVSEE